MGNINADQKLKLVQMIRSETQDNRLRMRSRERLLYGGSGKYPADEMPLYAKGYHEQGDKREKDLYALEEGSPEGDAGGSFFKLRLILAVFLFAGFLILDAGGGSVLGLTAARLQEEINKDFTTNIPEISLDFENHFPYTLFK